MILEKTKLVFFGTDEFAVAVLGQLFDRGIKPALVVTTPDRPEGRKLMLTSPPVKNFALKNHLDFTQPDRPKEIVADLDRLKADIFLVASYGRILPKTIIDLPRRGTLNIHPSLLPKLRGPAPIQNTILQSEIPGVTVMLIDEEIDHGPIIATRPVKQEKPLAMPELRDLLARHGANLFFEVLPKWLVGEIEAKEQEHQKATFTKKILKEDGEIQATDNPELNYRKFLAYTPWPGVYFFTERQRKKVRVIVKQAKLDHGNFIIERVLPEGSKEMGWNDFLRGS